MATKKFYATGSFKYQHRMLSAGDGPIEMNGRDAALYMALKKITATPPPRKRAEPDTPAEEAVVEEQPQRTSRRRSNKTT